ncbi:7868_t:CDS:2 [Funneliformis geosporum]|nr:7868_t:CDS:2 [Funneliformis geosporum]
MSWPKSLISSDGNYTQIGLEWPKIVAATTYCNFIYAIHPDGFIYKISTSSYTNVFKWAEAGGGWERAKAIFTYNDHICIVRDSICLDGTYHMVQNDNWGLHNLSQ